MPSAGSAATASASATASPGMANAEPAAGIGAVIGMVAAVHAGPAAVAARMTAVPGGILSGLAPSSGPSGRDFSAQYAGWMVLAAARRPARAEPAAASSMTAGQSVSARAVAAKARAGNRLAALLNNQAPTMSPTLDGQSAAGVVTGNLNVVDPDSSVFTFAVSAAPTSGSVTVDSTGKFVYTPAAGTAHNGVTDTFQVTVSDAASGFHVHGGLLSLLTFGLIGKNDHTSTSTVTVRVTPVNHAPTGTATVRAPGCGDGVVVGGVLGSDGDGDSLSYSGSAATSKGAVVVAADGGFTYTPTGWRGMRRPPMLLALPIGWTRFSVTVVDGTAVR